MTPAQFIARYDAARHGAGCADRAAGGSHRRRREAAQRTARELADAYGWTDYTPDMPDEEILRRLLVLNLERSASAK